MEPSWRQDSSFTPENFHQVVKKFSKINRVRKEDDNIDINTIFDQLTSIRITAGSIQEKDVNLLVEHCCFIISPDLGQLGIKCCILLSYVIRRSEVQLADEVLKRLVDFLILFVTKFDKWAHPDILQTLRTTLYGRGGTLPLQVLDGLVTLESGFLYKIIFDADSDILARKAALQCVGSLCTRCRPYLDDFYASQCLHIFLSVLKTRFPKADDFLQCKLLSTALEGIHEVTSNTRTAHGSLFGELLAALKAYNFFGRDDPSVNIPSCLHPTHIGTDIPASVINPSPPPRPQKKPTKKKTKTRKPKKEVTSDDEGGGGDSEMTFKSNDADTLPWRLLSGSESDYSDTESSGVTTKLQSYQTRVRQNSLTTLCTLLRASIRKVIFGYWTSFLPTSPDDTAGTLAAVLKNETSSRVKVAALAAVAAFLDKSRSALLVATERESSSTTPFTPFSVLLGNMIRELHNNLLNLVKTETASLTLTQALKCLATVIHNSPYQKLRPGLLSRTVKIIRPYLSHKDANIRVAVLTCMGAVVTIHAPLIEVSHILLPPAIQEDGVELESTKSSGEGNSRSSAANSLPGTPPSVSGAHSKATSSLPNRDNHVLWLIKTCGRCIHSSGTGTPLQLPIRLEALQVLTALVTGYLPLIRSSLEYLTNIIVQSLADSDPCVQLHGAKTSDSLAWSINRHFQQRQQHTEEGEDNVTFSIEEALVFWSRLLCGPLVAALQSETNTQLRATCCDCLSNIGVRVFESIETNQQIVCITMLLGLTSDPESLVRESAARALGVYVMFPCQRSDVSLVADIANAVMYCMKDECLGVCIKASWSMANVTDALLLNMSEDNFEQFANLFSDVLLLKLFDTATDASYGDDKMKYNGVRALGNLLRYLQPKTLERRNLTEMIENSVKLLVKSLSQGVMKVRWNASYALGSLLQNDNIVLPTAPWLEQVHTGLCLAMKNSKNFKVRINSAQALQMASARSKYGSADLFSSVWKYVIEAMHESTNTEDFTDYKYISSLSHQLSKAVLHLTSLTEEADLPRLGAVLFSKEDTIRRFLHTPTEPLDRTTSLENLYRLKEMKVGAEKLSVVDTLMSIIRVDDDTDDEKAYRSTFRPSYD